MSKVFKSGGWIVLSRDWEEDLDLCPHEWDAPIHRAEEVTVHRCRRSQCLGFHSPHRTSLEKFINFLRSIPKIPTRLPERGAFFSFEELAMRLNMDSRTIHKYYEAIKPFDMDGLLSYIQADSKMFIYLDDQPTRSVEIDPERVHLHNGCKTSAYEPPTTQLNMPKADNLRNLQEQAYTPWIIITMLETLGPPIIAWLIDKYIERLRKQLAEQTAATARAWTVVAETTVALMKI